MNAVPPSGPPEIAWPAIAAVALLTGLATLVHWWLRRRGLVPTGGNPIKLVAMRSLGGKRSVAIVEVESQRFLLGLTDETVSCLSSLPSEAKASALGTVVALPRGTSR
jgi:flagellar biogenesis protein FliO